MAVSAPTSTSNDVAVSSTPAVAGTNDATVTSDRFLKLLVAQMRNQDPLNPMDNAQVTSQMAQINTVTGIDKLNSTVQGLSTQFMQLQALHGRVQLLDPGHGVDLRHLARDLGVVHRIERVLVAHLRDEELEEAVRRDGRFVRARDGGRRADADVARGRLGCADGHGGVPVFAQPWPSWIVLSSSDLAVFITSRLFWYERDAEIMLTISSTALTLL